MREDRIMFLPEVAEALGITLGAVQQWRHWQMNGKPFRGVKIRKAGNGRLYCLKSDVDEFAVNYRPRVLDGGEVDDERAT